GAALAGTSLVFPTRRSSDLGDLVEEPLETEGCLVDEPGETESALIHLGAELDDPVRQADEAVADGPGDRLRVPEHRVEVLLELRSEEHTSELQSRENLVCRL